MPEHEKVRHLLKGIAEDVFQVILVHNPTTVKKIVEICQQFHELKTQRLSVAATVQRLPEVSSISAPPVCPDINSTSLRELIQQIVREEVSRALHPTLTSPTSTESALRSLVQTELASSIPSQVPLPLQTMRPTYAEIAAPTFTTNYPAGGMPYVQPFGYSQPRMQSAHQLINSRPVCYYCGIPGHVFRVCRRRQADESSASFRQTAAGNSALHYQASEYGRSSSPASRFPGSSASLPRRQSPSPQRPRSTSPMLRAEPTPRAQGGNL